jgi:hypothetical protein
MSDAEIERTPQHCLCIAQTVNATKVMPQSQGYSRQLQSALTAAIIFHFIVSIDRWNIKTHISPLYKL